MVTVEIGLETGMTVLQMDLEKVRDIFMIIRQLRSTERLFYWNLFGLNTL